MARKRGHTRCDQVGLGVWPGQAIRRSGRFRKNKDRSATVSSSRAAAARVPQFPGVSGSYCGYLPALQAGAARPAKQLRSAGMRHATQVDTSPVDNPLESLRRTGPTPKTLKTSAVSRPPAHHAAPAMPTPAGCAAPPPAPPPRCQAAAARCSARRSAAAQTP